MKLTMYGRNKKIKTLTNGEGNWYLTGIYPENNLDIAWLYFKNECIGSVDFSSLPEKDQNALSELLKQDWTQGREPFETW